MRHLTVNKANELRREHSEGMKVPQLSKKYGISMRHTFRVLANEVAYCAKYALTLPKQKEFDVDVALVLHKKGYKLKDIARIATVSSGQPFSVESVRAKLKQAMNEKKIENLK